MLRSLPLLRGNGPRIPLLKGHTEPPVRLLGVLVSAGVLGHPLLEVARASELLAFYPPLFWGVLYCVPWILVP